ncbi:MAG: hypothetical protein K6F09_05460 [Clostridiales bacterium]|nr:hypothetical protein [Clostridiales bacterium]
MKKKTVSLILALIIALCALPFSVNAEASASLYKVYGNGMVFRRDTPVTVAGTSKPGAEISFEIRDKSGQAVASGECTAESDGKFVATSDNGVHASYDDYTLTLYAEGEKAQELSGVRFGAVWIASGQSNMQMPLVGSRRGLEMMEKGETGSDNVRFLEVSGLIPQNGNYEIIPAEPQEDVESASWVSCADGTKLYNLSAVAFFFARDLQKSLDMPLGVLSTALGGSSIYTWLSRSSIDNDPVVKGDLEKRNAYIPLDKWKEDKINSYVDMTSCFNNRMYALRHFSPEGMIWYQGESNVGLDKGLYSHAFDNMQKSYTELFGLTETLPIVYTTIADYCYNNSRPYMASRLNSQFGEMQISAPDTRALITINDIPLDYLKDIQTIHPIIKEPVGEKMARAALGKVYGKYDCSSAPVYKSSEIKDGKVYITFENAGDGLMIDGNNTLYGFSVSGKDGAFVEADAEIINKDTVCIYSDSVKKPVYAAYSYALDTRRANLSNSENGKTLFRAVPFTTADADNFDLKYIGTRDFASCDFLETWCFAGEDSAETKCWDVSSGSAEIALSSDKASGEAAISLKGSDSFAVRPVNSVTVENNKRKYSLSFERDLSKYGAVSVQLKNCGNKPISLDEIRIITSGVRWYSPAFIGEKGVGAKLPADGQWHTYTFDLQTLSANGQYGVIPRKGRAVGDIKDIEFVFSGNGDIDILMDDIRFEADHGQRADKPAFSFGALIRAISIDIKNIFGVMGDWLKSLKK